MNDIGATTLTANDEELLANVPGFISVGGLLKATPSSEDGERFIYLEASNEDVDHQNEIVLQKALKASSDYYLRHGNIDLSHYSIMGPKAGIPNHLEYEIGKPVEVRMNGKKTFVKAQLYRGDSPQARNANMVWETLTSQQPPMRWYPSVGGAVLSKSVQFDPKTQQRVAVIEEVRWNNIALDRCPVNKTVSEINTAPIGVFAKALNGFVMAKTLEAGYGTDSATLTGGGAMRTQSLHGAPANYWDFRNKLASALKNGSAGKNPGARQLVEYAAKTFGVSLDEAAKTVERFMRDLNTELKNRSKS
jgi:hypothetical protein